MTRPRYLLHIDGDAFFASCEQAADPRLKRKPVVTGYERGMAVAVSYEAKALGIKRGDLVFKIRREHPECIIAPSHYELYERFSRRMLTVVRRYTPTVEAYSIDECFADLSDAYLLRTDTPQEIAKRIKKDIERELNVSFSFGIAQTKTLAKIASTRDKPSGFVRIDRSNYSNVLTSTPVSEVWGIGRATAARLQTYGINTAHDLAQKDRVWIEQNFSKPCVVTWSELRGVMMTAITTERKISFNSITRSRTFRPPTDDPDVLFTQLSKNIEGACRKARGYGLSSSTGQVFIKTQQFKYHSLPIRVPNSTNVPTPFIKNARSALVQLYKRGLQYRATGFTLTNLQPSLYQKSLFEQDYALQKMECVMQTADKLTEKYGSHMVYLSSSTKAMGDRRVRSVDSAHPTTLLIPIVSTVSRRIYLPFHGYV